MAGTIKNWSGVVAGLAAAVMIAPVASSARADVAGHLSPQLVQQAVPQTGLTAPEDGALARLASSLQMDALLEIMAVEGAAYGADLRDQMFPDRGGEDWQAQVARIYDPARMGAAFMAELGTALTGADLAPMLEFFESAQGTQLISLEISAREALLDDAVEDASREQMQSLRTTNKPFLDSLRDFVEANDLVEANIAGALNANYAFYTGLIEAGAFPETMSEAEVLADVWSQEPEIRAETEGWVYSYLAMAYRPLPEGLLDDYTAFSLTPAGQRLNSALFAAFDEVFSDISYQLGRAAGGYMIGENL